MQTAPSVVNLEKIPDADVQQSQCRPGGWGRRLAGNVLAWCWLRPGRWHLQSGRGLGIRKVGNGVPCKPSAPATITGIDIAFLLADAVACQNGSHQMP